MPPGTCLHFLSRIGFSIPTARRFHRMLLTHALALSADHFFSRKSPYEYVHSVIIELVKLILVGTRITYQATGDACIFFFFFFPIPFVFPMPLLISPFYSLSLLVVTQIRGHIAGSSPPYPLRFVPCIFIARRFQLFLPSSTRVELGLPTPGALSS